MKELNKKNSEEKQKESVGLEIMKNIVGQNFYPHQNKSNLIIITLYIWYSTRIWNLYVTLNNKMIIRSSIKKSRKFNFKYKYVFNGKEDWFFENFL